MNLYDITANLKAALDNIEVDENGELINTGIIEDAELAFNEKVENTALYIKNMTADIDAIASEIKALQARKKAKETKLEWIKDYLNDNLDAMEVDKFETARVKLSYRSSSSVNVYDLDQLPEEYKRTKVTVDPDKTSIKDAIKSGVIIPGAELVSGRSLQIK